MTDRIIALIDMDCFYAQVEQRENPELWDKPVAVAQRSGLGLGGIIALSYEARASGVKRGMMVPQAKSLCPDINICIVPFGEHIDKSDVTKYREASAEVFEVLNSFDSRITVEKASVDEAFLDLTDLVEQSLQLGDKESLLNRYLSDLDLVFPSSHIADGNDYNVEKQDDWVYDRKANLRKWIDIDCRRSDDHLRIAIAAEIVEQIREKIKVRTEFFCSGGVGINKMMAKLVCARHKPRQQTLIPHEFAPSILQNTPIEDIRFLGGKTGNAIQNILGITTMGDLASIPMERLAAAFPGQSTWISNMAKGLDDEGVKAKQLNISLAVSKQFPGKQILTTIADVKIWLDGLGKELAKRLVNDQNKNRRTASNLVLGVYMDTHMSRTVKLHSYNPRVISDIAWAALRTLNKTSIPGKWAPPICLLSLSASRFVEGVQLENRSIMTWVTERVNKLEGHKGGANTFGDEEIRKRCEKRKRSPNRTFDEPSPSKMRIDKDGWEMFDPSVLEDVIPLEEDPELIHNQAESSVSASENTNDTVIFDSSHFDEPETSKTQIQSVDDDIVVISDKEREIVSSFKSPTYLFNRPKSEASVSERVEADRISLDSNAMDTVDEETFNELPNFIKAEILHERQLASARELKARAEQRKNATEYRTKVDREKKKKKETSKKEEPKNGAAKTTISQFFKKS